MKTLLASWRQHLHRDFREQRVPFLSILGLCFVLAAVGALAFDARDFHGWPILVAVTGGVACALVLGIEMFGGDLRRGTAHFVARVPKGSAVSAQSKLTVIAATTVVVAALGFALGACTVYVGSDRGFELVAEHAQSVDRGVLFFIVFALSVAVWAMPMSCLLPRNSSALPITIALFTATFVPVSMAAQRIGPVYLELLEATWIPIWLTLAGMVATVIVFRAATRVRNSTGSLVRAGVVASVLFAPGVGAPWLHVADWETFRPDAPGVQVFRSFVSENGEQVFLDVYRETTGRLKGQETASYLITRPTEGAGPWRQIAGPSKYGIRSAIESPFSATGQSIRTIEWNDRELLLDANSARELSADQFQRMRNREGESVRGAILTPDGAELRRRGSRFDEYRNGEPTGRSVSVESEKFSIERIVGFGATIRRRGREELLVLDAVRMRASSRPPQTRLIGVMRSGWVVSNRVTLDVVGPIGRTPLGGFTRADGTPLYATELLNPVSGERRSLGLDPDEDVTVCLDAERVLVTRLDGSTWVLTLETGERELLEFDVDPRTWIAPVVRSAERLVCSGVHRGRHRVVFVDVPAEETPRFEVVELDDRIQVQHWDRADRLLVQTLAGDRVFWVDRDGTKETVFETSHHPIRR